MSARSIAEALGKAQREGKGWKALCPIHSDRSPSLSIRDTGNNVLVHCRVCGNDGQAALVDELKRRGLWPEPQRKPKAEIVATYDYRDESGALRYQVVRYQPKTFKQRRPDGIGGWKWKMDGVEPLPYRLPELLAAPNDAIFVVEGEKDCDALRSIGAVATCNSCGAGKWPASISRWLTGRDVVILPDNDDAGRKHARDVAAKLKGVAASVRALVLPGEGKDPADWVAAGGTLEELMHLAEEAAEDSATPTEENDCKSGDVIDRINAEHAVVRTGNKVVILMEFTNDFGGPDLALMGTDHFRLWHANEFIRGADGKQTPVADVWLRHQRRRQYNGITFNPGKVTPGRYNLWCGDWAVEPGPGDCSKLLDHMLINVAAGDKARFNWLVGWFAEIFQKPADKSGTSLVLRGESGTGKTFMFEAIGNLLGPHYALVDDDRYITGRFNSHMARLLLLFADEAFWAGDKTAEGRIRSMITGARHFIELKGIEPVAVPNHLRLGVAGNKTWMVPALMRDRRFCIYDIGERNIQDTGYFGAIRKQLDEGGRAGLLRYLLDFDLKTVDLRTIPRTEALFDSVVSSMSDIESWWFSILWSSELPRGCRGDTQCSKRALYRSYLKHAKDRNARGQRAIETQVGRFLKAALAGIVPGLCEEKADVVYADGYENFERTYIFPHLAKCRAAFAKRLGQTVQWPGFDPELMGPPLPDEEMEPEFEYLDVDSAIQCENWTKSDLPDTWDEGKVG